MSEIRRVRISADGTPWGTNVIDVGTGKSIPMAYAFDVHAAVGEHTRATIYVYNTELDITTDAKIVRVCPKCKRGVGGGRGRISRFFSWFKNPKKKTF